MAKRKRKKLIDKLDDVCREVIRLRDDYRCQWCNQSVKDKRHDVHHVIRRSNYILRFDLLNLVLLCYQCHNRFHEGLDGKEWFAKKYSARWCYLEAPIAGTDGRKKQRRYMTLKDLGITNADLQEGYEILKEKLKELQDG